MCAAGANAAVNVYMRKDSSQNENHDDAQEIVAVGLSGARAAGTRLEVSALD
jgi:hypothetical protein